MATAEIPRRWAWPGLAAVLTGGLALRLWGLEQGLPYAYNTDEADHFVPRAVAMFGHSLNPHYFANPPAFTYLLHYLFAIAYGGKTGVRSAFALHPGEVYTLARVAAAVLGTAAVWLLYATGARLFSRAVGLLAAAIEAVAFLPVFYAHLALNDAPTLAPLTLSLLGSAGVLRKGRARDYLLAGVGLGLACATKYTAGIVLLPFAAAVAARYLDGGRGAGRRAVVGIASTAAVALLAFLIANPYSVLDYSAFHSELIHQSTLSAEAQGKLGAPRQGGLSYYLWSLTWGLGWAPALAALGGALTIWRVAARRAGDGAAGGVALGWLLVPAVVLFLAFMGLQGRYFGRWLLPIFPILCLLASFFVLALAEALARLSSRAWRSESLRSRPVESAPRGSERAPRRGLSAGLYALLVAAVLAQGLLYSVHSGLVLSRADTRNLTRAWLVVARARRHADRGRAGRAGGMDARTQARDLDRRKSLSLAAIPGGAVEDLAGRSAGTERGAARGHRGLRAHARPGVDRLLRAQRLLLDRERHDPVRPCVRRSGGGAGGGRLLPRSGPPERSRLSRLSIRAREGAGRVRLRLEL